MEIFAASLGLCVIAVGVFVIRMHRRNMADPRRVFRATPSEPARQNAPVLTFAQAASLAQGAPDADPVGDDHDALRYHIDLAMNLHNRHVEANIGIPAYGDDIFDVNGNTRTTIH